jgi:muramoyltetrapeptide carboxypeptidase LdcA involved in peptidoglycan recycling
VVALLGGSFTHEERGEYLGPSIDEVLARWSARLRIPTLARLPYGHLDDALVLPYRAATSISLRADGRWSVTITGASLDLG